MRKTVALHAFLWLLYGVLEYQAYPDARVLQLNIFFLLRMALYIGLFYFNALFLFDRLFRRNTVVRGLAYWLLSAAVFYFLLSYIFHVFYFDVYEERLRDLQGLTRKPLTSQQITNSVVMITAIYYLFIFLGALFYWLYRRVRITSATAERLKREKLEKENETIRFQNMFLRSQINPHFLHNTLNFFYAKALPLSPELSEGILTLSNVMRYSLQNEEDTQGLVPLEREVEHLQNVILIHQMRFSHRLNINFVKRGDITQVKVIPLVFITLLENAFKHGDMSNESTPVSILLEADEQTARLLFTISNRKRTGPREISHGIGIENIRQRLKNSYKDDHSFVIKNEGDFYEVKIELPFIPNDKPAA